MGLTAEWYAWNHLNAQLRHEAVAKAAPPQPPDRLGRPSGVIVMDKEDYDRAVAGIASEKRTIIEAHTRAQAEQLAAALRVPVGGQPVEGGDPGDYEAVEVEVSRIDWVAVERYMVQHGNTTMSPPAVRSLVRMGWSLYYSPHY